MHHTSQKFRVTKCKGLKILLTIAEDENTSLLSSVSECLLVHIIITHVMFKGSFIIIYFMLLY